MSSEADDNKSEKHAEPGSYAFVDYQEPKDEMASAVLALVGDDVNDDDMMDLSATNDLTLGDEMAIMNKGKEDKDTELKATYKDKIEGVDDDFDEDKSEEEEKQEVDDQDDSPVPQFSTAEVTAIDHDDNDGSALRSVPVVPAILVLSDEEQAHQEQLSDLRQQKDELFTELQQERESMQELKKRRVRRCRILVAFIILVAVAIALTVGLLTTRNTAATSYPPTGSPPPTLLTFKPMTTTQELYGAVDRWLTGENSSDSSLADTYGYPIGSWDVSFIEDFSRLFDACEYCDPPGRQPKAATFNDDISYWDLSNAKNTSFMFRHAKAFNSSLSDWDVSRVTDMTSMFFHAAAFGSDLNSWNVSSVVDMSQMFFSASSFDADLTNWNVANVKDMSSMFFEAYSFNADLSAWNVSRVTDMNFMFYYASAFDADLSNWDVSRVVDLSYMFANAYNFNADLSSWNVSAVVDMSHMFDFANSFDQDLCLWGNRLASNVYTGDAFFSSGCQTASDPNLRATVPGPFCHKCS